VNIIKVENQINLDSGMNRPFALTKIANEPIEVGLVLKSRLLVRGNDRQSRVGVERSQDVYSKVTTGLTETRQCSSRSILRRSLKRCSICVSYSVGSVRSRAKHSDAEKLNSQLKS